ncbi:hypothetical protein KEM56_005960 [Ascosphaera pollenicola]|nr:hypothetical protein KEM56_005960 [Ascosphaera pollenicola]
MALATTISMSKHVQIGTIIITGILISSTPIAVNKATADIAIFLMLGALRFAWIPIKGIREHNWQGSGYQLGYDPEEKTLGILGMGGIGGEVAKRAKAFDMKVIYHNRHRLPAEKECGAEYVSFDELLARADVLSLNLSLNPSTKHIISTEEFKKMKDGVVIINTARGALIDEDALVKALDAGKIRSVGLDVYENEPSVHEGLLKNEKVMLLPHLGTGTWETQKKMEDLVLDNLREALEKGRLITPIPEQKGVYGEITSKM